MDRTDRVSRIQVFTDGGCKPNPGPGGWGAIIRIDEKEFFLSGNDPNTTNNQMEIQAAIAALGLLAGLFEHCQVELYTDSEYLRQGITGWIDKWEHNGWQTKGGQDVKNKSLWQALQQQVKRHDVAWHWLKGHMGHPDNERADRLATRARLALRRPAAALQEPAAPVPQSEVTIYVKASFNQKQNVGGWGVVLRMGEHTRSLSQPEHGSSANALLVRAAAEGLWKLSRPCSVAIVSDADYLIRGASQWIKGWLARDWQTKTGQPVANRALWEALLAAMQPHRVSWHLAKAEATPDLARAGELAAAAAANSEPSDTKSAGN